MFGVWFASVYVSVSALKPMAYAVAVNRSIPVTRDRAVPVATTALERRRERWSVAKAGGLRQVAWLADPVGHVVDGWVRPNGLRIEQVRVPLGVVAIIYENRPNVTSDAFGLCLKSGNAAFLRGSSGALESNKAITAV